MRLRDNQRHQYWTFSWRTEILFVNANALCRIS